MKKIFVGLFVGLMVATINNNQLYADEYLGRLTVSGTSIDVSVYHCNMLDLTEDAQAIVDDPEKAVALDWNGLYYCPVALSIADHTNQGFKELYDVVPGETVAELYYPDGNINIYVCETIDRGGVNDEVHILTSDGYPAELTIPEDWLWMYTCNPEGWWTVTIVFFKPFDEANLIN